MDMKSCVRACTLQAMGKEKKVWRLAFFSRLEERKGIKLFVDAVSSLNTTGIDNFEASFTLRLQLLHCCVLAASNAVALSNESTEMYMHCKRFVSALS